MFQVVGEQYAVVQDSPRPGGQATVRKAVDMRDGSPVALKILNGPSDDVLRRIFERETSALKSLNHPNIIGLKDSGYTEDGTYYLVLEWIDETFADTLRHGTAYEWEDLAETIARPLLSALSYAHQKEVEHRDIKPGNVLLRGGAVPVLADFGISKLRQDIQHTEFTVARFKSRPYAPTRRRFSRSVCSRRVFDGRSSSAVTIDYSD